MLKNSLLWMLCSLSWVLSAQKATYGDQSPIFLGVSNSVKYHNKEKTSIQLPPEVIPLLSGILIVNQADPKSKSFQQGMNAWIEKYTTLQQRINALKEGSQKAMAQKLLLEGNFPEIDRMLATGGGYQALLNFFPASYQTIGDQSPIMVGDYATVSYVVNKVIEYKLPESLTQNILNRVYAQDKKIESLSVKITDRDKAIESWIASYRELETTLRNSPDSLYKSARYYFNKGMLDSALVALNKTQGASNTLSQISYLKAQIQILQFDFSHYEAEFNEINKNFKVATLLDDKNAQVLYSYGRFFSEFAIDNNKRIEILEQVNQVIPEDSVSMKYKTVLDLYEAYANVQRNLTAVEYLEKAERYAAGFDDPFQKTEAIFFVHVAYSRIFGQTNQIASKMAHCDSALAICVQYPAIKAKNLRYWYVVRLNQAVEAVLAPSNKEAAIANYLKILSDAEVDLGQSATNQLFLFERYGFIANQCVLNGNWQEGKRILDDVAQRIKPLINPKGRLFFQLYFNNWLTLLNILSNNVRYVEWEKELKAMEEILTKLNAVEPSLYIEQTARWENEYGIYLMVQNKSEEALVWFKKNLEFFLKILPKYPENYALPTAKCIGNIGSCYANLFKPAEGIAYLQSQIEAINKIQYLDDKNYTFSKINMYRQIGTLFNLDGKIDSSRVYMQKGLFEAEKRLTTSNDAFLYDFITLSYDYSNTYVSFDNAKAIEIVEKAREKTTHYISINPALRQRYLTDLAYVTAYTGHVYSLSKDFQHANLAYLEAYRLYAELTQPNQTIQYMSAYLLTEYCDFLHNASFLFPKLTKKESNEIKDNKCRYIQECISKWEALPNDQVKMGNLNRLKSYLQSCN